VSRRLNLPTDEQVRVALADVIEQAHNEGRRPTITALAAALGLNSSTFWRQFPASPATWSTALRYRHPLAHAHPFCQATVGTDRLR
jgi:hypothetical protein